MKTHPRRGSAAFTLIELMTVIAIIVILAALVVGSIAYVQDKQNREKARVQMARIAQALEEYKLENGSYPATADVTAILVNPNGVPAGTSTSSILFNALFFDPYQKNAKIYLPELDPTSSKQGWTTAPASANSPIVDPWGNQYCYRTATNAAGAANTSTQSPDFDLWSMGKDGQTDSSSPTNKVNRDDIKNN